MRPAFRPSQLEIGEPTAEWQGCSDVLDDGVVIGDRRQSQRGQHRVQVVRKGIGSHVTLDQFDISPTGVVDLGLRLVEHFWRKIHANHPSPRPDSIDQGRQVNTGPTAKVYHRIACFQLQVGDRFPSILAQP